MKRVFVQARAYWRIERAAIKSELPRLLPAGHVTCSTLHWTAGSYTTGYRAYQILIGLDHILVSETLLNWSIHQHTYLQNSKNIGVAFMAMAGATERNAGQYPVTKNMIEDAALIVAHLQRRYGLGPGQLTDHAYWAKRDGYAGLRWDCQWPVPWEGRELLTDVVRRKAKWYADNLSA